MGKEWIWIALVAVAGFLLGGVYSAWKTSKAAAGVLMVLTLLAAGGAIAWYTSI